MIEHWTGIIHLNDVEVNVNATKEKPDNKLGSWYGTGQVSESDILKILSDNPREYHTEIGDYIDVQTGHFTFQGSGEPKF